MKIMNSSIIFVILLLTACSILGENEVSFYLYNGANSSSVSEILIGNDATLKSLKAELPVRILVHGWKGKYDTYPIPVLRDAYLQKGNLNVIVVDWQQARDDEYFTVTASLKAVAQTIANMIKFLNEKAKVNNSKVYLAGHSLGAHLAALTARQLKPNKIDTIFALDPARFLVDNNDFLKADDAAYVEVIHSNTDPVGVGMRESSGTADFYPNYGRMQPSCHDRLVKIFCNHMAAVLYLAESINSTVGFWGYQCPLTNIFKGENCQCKDQCAKFRMGGEPSARDANAKGNFYMETNAKYPYAMGK